MNNIYETLSDCDIRQILMRISSGTSFNSVQSCRVITVDGAWGKAGQLVTEVKWYQVLGTSVPKYIGASYFNEQTRAEVKGVSVENSVPCKDAFSDEQVNVESDDTWDYFAIAPAGTPLTEEKWKVYRVNKSSGAKQFLNGSASYSNVGSGLTGLTYSFEAA